MKLKNIVAGMAAVMMIGSIGIVGANATSSDSGSTSRTNSAYSNSISHTYDGRNTTLNVGYYYGGTTSGKSDLLSTYGYNTVLGYKYATVNVNGSTSTSSGVTDQTTAQLSRDKESISSGSAAVYGGYVKTSTGSSTKRYKMQFTLTLN